MRLGVVAAQREVILEMQLNREGPNRSQVNRNVVKSRELMRWFSCVLFAPEDLTIVRGEPSARRRFLDDSLLARHPVAAGALADYDRVVRQRNSLLKSVRSGGVGSQSLDATLAVWDDQLVEYGSQIMLARRELVRDLAGPVARGYGELVQQNHHPALTLSESVSQARNESSGVSRETVSPEELASVSRETVKEEFFAALSHVRSREVERGLTLLGPHRDDLILALNGLPVKGYASHGESWSFVVSLKMALASVLRNESPAGDPVIILDDVFAELDLRRRMKLMAAVSEYEQVIVTAAVEEDVPDDVPWNRIRIEAGSILEEQL
jgi:DNA replication and repair protein RecF